MTNSKSILFLCLSLVLLATSLFQYARINSFICVVEIVLSSSLMMYAFYMLSNKRSLD